MKITGNLTVQCHDVNTKRTWFPVVEKRNLVTDVGKNNMRNLLLGPGISGDSTPVFAPQAIAIGTGSSTPAVTDIALDTEVFRKAMTRRVASPQKATFQMLVLTSEANGNTLTEAGLFETPIDDASGMIAQITYSGITKTVSIEVTYTWDITVS